MKKLLLTILSLALTVSIMAQQAPASARKGTLPPPGRDNEFVCQAGSVFSQVYPVHDNGIYCQAGYGYYLVADNYSATAPFSTFRFWGGDYYGCTLAPTEPFTVIIYNGDPSAGGTPVFTSTLPGTVTPIGVISFGNTPLYQIDINLGTTITQLNGWIGVTRINPSCDVAFGWTSDLAGNSLSYDGTWVSTESNLMFCLGGGNEEVPVSDWALYIGLGLILVFTVVRFRKIV